MFTPEEIWEPNSSFAEAVTEKEISAAESNLGVKLPSLLKSMLLHSNGGQILDEDVMILPIGHPYAGIRNLVSVLEDDEELIEEVESFDWNPSQIIVFSTAEDGHTMTALNYCELSESGEPLLLWIDTECCTVEQMEFTFEDFISELVTVEPNPIIEFGNLVEGTLIAEEDFEVEVHGTTLTVRQKIHETPQAVFIDAHEVSTDGEQLSRCRIEKPIKTDDCTINHYRPEPTLTYHLTLSPEKQFEDESITWWVSRRSGDGWKNQTTEGAPVYALVESPLRDRLVTIREQVLGGPPDPAVYTEEKYLEQMENVSEDEMAMLMPQLMQQMMAQADLMLADVDPSQLPPEALEMHEAMQKMKEQVMKKTKDQPTADELPPHLQELLGSMSDFMGERLNLDEEEE